MNEAYFFTNFKIITTKRIYEIPVRKDNKLNLNVTSPILSIPIEIANHILSNKIATPITPSIDNITLRKPIFMKYNCFSILKEFN